MGERYFAPRFYVICAITVALVVCGVLFLTRGGADSCFVEYGTLGDTVSFPSVILRNEKVVCVDPYTKVDFAVGEGAPVAQGDTVAGVYTVGYSEKEMNNLDSVRSEIREYYGKSQEYILDGTLEGYNAQVSSCAEALGTVIRSGDSGNVVNVSAMLEDAMTRRQDYLREAQRDDPALSSLYQRETQLMASVSSWCRNYTAPYAGIVSFYLDGYESTANASTFDTITLHDLRAVQKGSAPSVTNDERTQVPLYRIVDTSSWSVLVQCSNDYPFNLGAQYTVTFHGYEDYVFQATAAASRNIDGVNIIRLDINDDVRPVLDLRNTTVELGTAYSGLKIPARAVSTANGMTGVNVIYENGYTFVPVHVIYTDGKNAIVEPYEAGNLYAGMRVRIG